jgi:hypothetical protein
MKGQYIEILAFEYPAQQNQSRRNGNFSPSATNRKWCSTTISEQVVNYHHLHPTGNGVLQPFLSIW